MIASLFNSWLHTMCKAKQVVLVFVALCRMRGDFVCSLLLLLCRLQHKNDKFVKLALVFLKVSL